MAESGAADVFDVLSAAGAVAEERGRVQGERDGMTEFESRRAERLAMVNGDDLEDTTCE